MATHKEREQFIAALSQALPDKPAHIVTHYARLLLRHAATHGRLAEEECNGPGVEKRQAQVEKRMAAIASELGLTADFGGDPRGYTVKLHLPTGVYNTWGGRESGYGVPQ